MNDKEYVVSVGGADGRPKYKIEDTVSGEKLFECYLHDETLNGLPQIHIETGTDVYDGPIRYLLWR
jgi:hypothetical protein